VLTGGRQDQALARLTGDFFPVSRTSVHSSQQIAGYQAKDIA
jgi:hypothetical protein